MGPLPEDVAELVRAGREHVGEPGGTPSEGAPVVHVLVLDDDGNLLYRTWQGGPLESWERTTLWFGKTRTDRAGNEIGLSTWT